MRLSSCLLLCAALFSASCSTESLPVPRGVRERISGPTYHTRVVAADQRATYTAAKEALKRLGYTFVRGGAAQGKLTGLSRLAMSTDLQGARQVQLDVRLTPAAEGTEVAVLLSEIIEDNFNRNPGMGTSAPLRDTPLYEVYLRHVQDVLEGR